MRNKRALFIGVLIALVFSVWPLHSLNGIFCLGITIGGGVAAYLAGRHNRDTLSTTNGILLGGAVGAVTAVVALAINLVLWLSDVRLPGPTGYFDSVPAYLFAFLEGLWDSIRSISKDQAEVFSYDPHLYERFIIDLLLNTLHGAFGGVIVASAFFVEPAPGSGRPLFRRARRRRGKASD